MALLRSLLKQFGLKPNRLELAWVSAGEAEKFATTINSFIERIVEIGPSPYRKQAPQTAGEKKEVVDA
jgi:coenzyme F420-reducing hydrogenase delta subunit